MMVHHFTQADMKFTYIVTCQRFGSQKAVGDPRAQDIIDLMLKYFPAMKKFAFSSLCILFIYQQIDQVSYEKSLRKQQNSNPK